MTYRAGVVKVPRIPPKYSWKDPLQGFIYASSPSCLTILNILINKALMRHRHQVRLSIIIQMPKVWLWSEEWCVAQSPAWRFGFCICARLRIPVKKQCFSVCVACCKIHAWKTLRKEVYCGIAVLVIAKFAAHLCCVCFFYFFFFWSRPEGFLSRELGIFQVHWILINSADTFVVSVSQRRQGDLKVLDPRLNLSMLSLNRALYTRSENTRYCSVLLKTHYSSAFQSMKVLMSLSVMTSSKWNLKTDELSSENSQWSK